MNQIAVSIPCRSSAAAAPEIVAKLDLADENQARLQDLIQRFHVGRWPIFKCLGMRQIGGVICEAVEWRRKVRPRYGVVRWQPDGLGLSWKDVASAQVARAMLTSMAAA